MKRLKIAATFVVAAAVVLGSAQAAQAVDYGVDMSVACSIQTGTNLSVILANNVNGWQCRFGGGWNYVNINQECVRTHGGSLYASYTNFKDPYSWRCNW